MISPSINFRCPHSLITFLLSFSATAAYGFTWSLTVTVEILWASILNNRKSFKVFSWIYFLKTRLNLRKILFFSSTTTSLSSRLPFLWFYLFDDLRMIYLMFYPCHVWHFEGYWKNLWIWPISTYSTKTSISTNCKNLMSLYWYTFTMR